VCVGLIATSSPADVRLVRRVNVRVLLAVGTVGKPSSTTDKFTSERSFTYNVQRERVNITIVITIFIHKLIQSVVPITSRTWSEVDRRAFTAAAPSVRNALSADTKLCETVVSYSSSRNIFLTKRDISENASESADHEMLLYTCKYHYHKDIT